MNNFEIDYSSYEVRKSLFATTPQGQRVVQLILLVSCLSLRLIVMETRHSYLLSTNI